MVPVLLLTQVTNYQGGQLIALHRVCMVNENVMYLYL